MKVSATLLARTSMLLARESGVTPTASDRTAAALATFDGERITSVVGILDAFGKKRAAIEADRELSDHGKRERIRGAADSVLGNVASLAKKIAALEAEHAHDRATAVPLPKADAADVALDLALVAHVRSLEPIPSALLQMSERTRLAVARTPIELSGVKPEVQAKVHGSLMSPAKAVQLASESEAIGAAHKVVQAALEELAPHAAWQPREWVEHFGAGGWRLPGVTDSLAEKLATSGDAAA